MFGNFVRKFKIFINLKLCTKFKNFNLINFLYKFYILIFLIFMILFCKNYYIEFFCRIVSLVLKLYLLSF